MLPPALLGLSRSTLLRPRLSSCFATTPTLRDDSSPHRLYISDSVDPWFNLAFEDWLYRKSDPSMPLLFMYRNRPSVIIGRNQNPWMEVNLPLLASKGIPFVRRRSGGGTVYHDLGNTNFSIFVPHSTFDRRTNAELVARALQSLGVNAKVNVRNDITLDGFKISGSAFKLNNRRALHHGTMLIDAKLGELGDALKTATKSITSNNGTASVPSPVQNIITNHPSVTHDKFVNAVVDEFRRMYEVGKDVRRVSEDSLLKNERPEIEKEMRDLKSWSWSHGQTPQFHLSRTTTNPSSTTTLTSKHGLITALISEPPSPALEKFAEKVVGRRFGDVEDVLVMTGEEEKEVRDLKEWLRGEM